MSFVTTQENIKIDCKDISWVSFAETGAIRAQTECHNELLQGKNEAILSKLECSDIDFILAIRDFSKNLEKCYTKYFLNPNEVTLVLCGDDFHLQCNDAPSYKFIPMDKDLSAEIGIGELRANYPDIRQTFDSSTFYDFTPQ